MKKICLKYDIWKLLVKQGLFKNFVHSFMILRCVLIKKTYLQIPINISCSFHIFYQILKHGFINMLKFDVYIIMNFTYF